jgi:O-acetyl-ADP-ribose deacetylase (regulator of RNase III)
MLKVVDGNLLLSNCQVMAHQANCFSTMGAGIAKQIAVKWPAVVKADSDYYPTAPFDKLGKVSRALVEGDKLMIYNLYGQYNYGAGKQQTNYEALTRAVRMMFEELKQLPMFKQLRIGVPYGMGCGLAGGNWTTVQGILNDLSNEYGVDIYAYRLV